jgi:hypothetical protein
VTREARANSIVSVPFPLGCAPANGRGYVADAAPLTRRRVVDFCRVTAAL